MTAIMEKELITILQLNRQLHRAIADALDKKIGFVIPTLNRALVDLHNCSNAFDNHMLFVGADSCQPAPRSRKEAAKIRARKLTTNKSKKDYIVGLDYDPMLAVEALRRAGQSPQTIKRLVPEAYQAAA